MKTQFKKPKFKIDEIMLVLIVAFIAMIMGISSKLNEPREMEAERITNMILDDNHVSFASNGIIDGSKMREIRGMDYDDFKKSVNAKNDFCVYIEDGDGNLILAKGSSKLSKDGIFCRE